MHILFLRECSNTIVSFSFWCHAWVYIFFLRGSSNVIISFSCLLFLLYLIYISFSRFLLCFPFSSKFSHSLILFFFISISHWKFTSNLECGCECGDEMVCEKKAFTNIQNSHRHTKTHWNRQTLLKLKLLRIHFNLFVRIRVWVDTGLGCWWFLNVSLLFKNTPILRPHQNRKSDCTIVLASSKNIFANISLVWILGWRFANHFHQQRIYYWMKKTKKRTTMKSNNSFINTITVEFNFLLRYLCLFT